MGYNAWISFEHAPITREQFEEIAEAFPNYFNGEEGFEYDEKNQQIVPVDELKNPEFDEIEEIAKKIAEVTKTPVVLHWQDDEGDYSEIFTPAGKSYPEIRLFRTDLGEFYEPEKYINEWLRKQIFEETKKWDEEDFDEFNGTTWTLDKNFEVMITIDPEQGKIFWTTPNGNPLELSPALERDLLFWALEEIKEMNGGEENGRK